MRKAPRGLMPAANGSRLAPYSVSLAFGRGLNTSVEFASVGERQTPPGVSRTLIEQVRATGIEVPQIVRL